MNLPNTSKGILYVATGEKFLLESVKSARSVKRHMPDCPMSICTDQPNHPALDIFDDVREINYPTHSFLDKITPLAETPYDKTLFLDTDTFIMDSVDDVFLLLDRFDLAYCHAPERYCPKISIKSCPTSFTEPNTGVFAYRKTDEVLRTFDDWKRRYLIHLEQVKVHDQPAFREALFHSSLNLYVLPPEYNTRTPFPVFKGGQMKTKILHGRNPSLALAKGQINKRLGIRVYDFGKYERMRWKLKNLWKRLFNPALKDRGM